MGWPFPDDHVIYHMHQPQDGVTSSYFYGTHVQITLDYLGEKGLHYPRIIQWSREPLMQRANGDRYRSTGYTTSPITVVEADGTTYTRGEPRHIDGQSAALGRAFSGLAVLAHEAVHYYFTGAGGNSDSYAPWVVEGPPVFLTYLIIKHLNPELPFPDLNTFYTAHDFSLCEEDTLAETERMEESFERSDCMYLLGGQLFEDLHNHMDETNFRMGLRRLFLHTRVNTPVCDNDRTSICHVREAFSMYASPEKRPTVQAIIERWYGN